MLCAAKELYAKKRAKRWKIWIPGGRPPRQIWEILELSQSEALEGVDGAPLQAGWKRVEGTPDFETKEEAEAAMKLLLSAPE